MAYNGEGIIDVGKDLTTDDGKVTTGEITVSLHNPGYIDAIEIPTELRNKGFGKESTPTTSKNT